MPTNNINVPKQGPDKDKDEAKSSTQSTTADETSATKTETEAKNEDPFVEVGVRIRDREDDRRDRVGSKIPRDDHELYRSEIKRVLSVETDGSVIIETIYGQTIFLGASSAAKLGLVHNK